MTNDPHSENRKLYEQDALETDKPWEWWESKPPNYQEWLNCGYEPAWYPAYAYRRKTTLTINGHPIPMPLYAKPKGVEVVYVLEVHLPYLYVAIRVWAVQDDEWRLGIYHLTAEAATLHAKAVLSFSERKKP